MDDLKELKKKVYELQQRMARLEGDQTFMKGLYNKAAELVVKNNKASVIFLQRKLLIDVERASKIMQELEVNGVVGPEVGGEPRKVLAKI